MDAKFFVAQVERLESNYEKKLDKEVKAQWFETLKTLPEERVKNIVTYVIQNEEFMPRLSTMIETNKMLSIRENQYKERKKEDCDYCKGKGFLMYTQRRENIDYDFVARCFCSNSEQYSAFPTLEQVGLKKEMFLE